MPVLRFFYLICLGLLWACSADSLEVLRPSATDEEPAEVSFAGDVLPLMQTYCSLSGCHDGSNAMAKPLLSYADIRPQAEAVATSLQEGSMPIGRSMHPDEVRLILRWIEQGAPQN